MEFNLFYHRMFNYSKRGSYYELTSEDWVTLEEPIGISLPTYWGDFGEGENALHLLLLSLYLEGAKKLSIW